jgi:acid stress-induced BolA-like protein IbaG/YrbA
MAIIARLRVVSASLRDVLDARQVHTSTTATFCAASQLATLAQ